AATGGAGWTVCQAGCAWAVAGGAWEAAGGAAAGGVSDFENGQKLHEDDAAGCAPGAGRCRAIEAGSAKTDEAAKRSALTAAGIDLRQVWCMAVPLDIVDRQHPCRRLSYRALRETFGWFCQAQPDLLLLGSAGTAGAALSARQYRRWHALLELRVGR